MRGLVMLLAIGSFLALAGCEMDECKAYPPGSAAYKTCINAVLQRQSGQQDRQLRMDFRGKQ
ncbi:MAG: hypothetical protein ACREFK_03360 [Stellaceae bacterium]